MNTLIENFYEENKIQAMLLEQRRKKFDQNPDIAAEFEYWIKNRTYKEEGAVSIEGYTAKKLSEMSGYLEGEGAFMILIELRENPEKAMDRIAKGFKRK